jgi:hypothetical protein
VVRSTPSAFADAVPSTVRNGERIPHGVGRNAQQLPVGVVGSPLPERLVMPPGGVIGAPPASGARSNSPPVRRVAPAGGVIGNTNGDDRVNAAGVPLASTGSGRHRQQSSRRQRPEERWSVREGVPPVIYPPPEPRIDPGPGIIGIDR